VVLEEGGLVVASGGRAGEGFLVPGGVRKRTLRLPRAALEAAGSGGDIPDSFALEQDRPFVHLIHVLLREVWSKLPGMNAAETEAARAALVTLLAAAIRAAGEGSAYPGSSLLVLRAQLEQWIVGNLNRATIRVEDLATAHNVSTRTVHRTFALTGDTMTGVVRARRVAGVREDLVHTDLTIAAIAYRWNYYDPSHLGREFRRHYGISPGDYRQTYGALRTSHTLPSRCQPAAPRLEDVGCVFLRRRRNRPVVDAVGSWCARTLPELAVLTESTRSRLACP
jgi:AraC family transcriptional activator of tynA and feaB